MPHFVFVHDNWAESRKYKNEAEARKIFEYNSASIRSVYKVCNGVLKSLFRQKQCLECEAIVNADAECSCCDAYYGYREV